MCVRSCMVKLYDFVNCRKQNPTKNICLINKCIVYLQILWSDHFKITCKYLLIRKIFILCYYDSLKTEMCQSWEFPFPRIWFPFPEFPNIWEFPNIGWKKVIPIPAHSHGNMGIPGEFPNPKKSEKNQKIWKKFPKLKNV